MVSVMTSGVAKSAMHLTQEFACQKKPLVKRGHDANVCARGWILILVMRLEYLGIPTTSMREEI
jgi:hypothetical protein